jgi:hypothetical protein
LLNRSSGEKIADAAERNGLLETDRFQPFPPVQQARLLNSPVKESVTKLVEFGTSPFPYDGARRSYSDRRVHLHIPAGFDARRPAVMVLFFERDVRDRQQVPAQISASDMNAVLVAPQLAVDAADSSVGRLAPSPGAYPRQPKNSPCCTAIRSLPRVRTRGIIARRSNFFRS